MCYYITDKITINKFKFCVNLYQFSILLKTFINDLCEQNLQRELNQHLQIQLSLPRASAVFLSTLRPGRKYAENSFLPCALGASTN